MQVQQKQASVRAEGLRGCQGQKLKGSQECGGKDSLRPCEAPHPALLSTPTHPTVREGPGEK